MTVEKAIEILDIKIKQNVFQVDPDAFIALKLGKEAMKRETQHRQMAKSEHIWLLPGETTD